jgi:hypothetical protein
MGGARMAVTRERKCVTARVHKLEGKGPFGEYAKALWAEWAKQGGGDLRGKVDQRGRAGLTGLDPSRRFKWKLIFKFQMNLDFGKNLWISTRRFRRNLDIRIFPKFF